MKNNLNKLTLLSTSLLIMSSCGTGGASYPTNYDLDTNGVTIDMWTPFGSNTIEPIFEERIEQFEEIYNITVNVETKGSYDTLSKAIIGAATSQKYPHLTLAYPDHMANYVNSDIILRLDTFLEKDNETNNSSLTEEDKFSFSSDDFYEDYMEENKSVEFKEDGTGYVLGVPFNKSTEVMVYNKTFMEWASSQDNLIKIPTTYDELEVVGEHILALMEGKYGKYIGSDNNVYNSNEECPGKEALLDFSLLTKNGTGTGDENTKFIPFSYDSQANFFITLCRQFGGEYTDVDPATGKGKLKFNSAAVKNGLNKIKSLYNKGILAIPASFGEAKYNSNPFKRMQTVMNIGSTAGADNALPQAGRFELGSAPVLYNDENNKYVISQGTNLCLLDRGTDVEKLAAYQLLRYLSKKDNAQFAVDSGYFPSCEYAQNSEVYQEFLARTDCFAQEIQNQQIAQINNDIYMSSTGKWHKFVDTPFVGSALVREEVGTIIPLLLIENKTPDEVINAAYQNLADFN